MLSGKSLLEWWHSPDALLCRDQKNPTTRFRNTVPDPPDQAELSALCNWNLSSPIELLSNKKGFSAPSKGTVCRCWTSGLPGQALPTSTQGVFAPSPGFCLFQQAQKLTLPQATALGCEFTGTYRFMRDEQTRFDVQPATTLRRMHNMAEALAGKKGAALFRSILPFVIPECASPTETLGMLLLCLPNKYGGFGTEKPVPNFKVMLSPQAAAMLHKKTCRCDLYFPKANIDVEYDGYDDHTGKAKLEQDAQRRAAIEESGIRVVTLTFQQLLSPERLSVIANILFHASGKRFRPRCQNFEARQQELWHDLLFWNPFI